jgi:hypothetical protein
LSIIALVRAPTSLSTWASIVLGENPFATHEFKDTGLPLADHRIGLGSCFAVLVAEHHLCCVVCVAENPFAAHDFEDSGLPLVDHRIVSGSRFALHVAEHDFLFVLGKVGLD